MPIFKLAFKLKYDNYNIFDMAKKIMLLSSVDVKLTQI